jgi:hypothetical protein
VGGFIGVPAMIYIFGVPTAVAAGTELYLAMYMGAWGAIGYAWGGFVDLRLVLLLYLGSLTGIYIGAYGTKVVKENLIRLVTAIIILLCVVSRAVNIPVYLDLFLAGARQQISAICQWFFRRRRDFVVGGARLQQTSTGAGDAEPDRCNRCGYVELIGPAEKRPQ